MRGYCIHSLILLDFQLIFESGIITLPINYFRPHWSMSIANKIIKPFATYW